MRILNSLLINTSIITLGAIPNAAAQEKHPIPIKTFTLMKLL